jgi:hypothetical protein
MAETVNSLTPLLLDAKDAAVYVGIGRTLFLAMDSDGRLGPVAVKLGRRTLWRRRGLAEWVELGCPCRDVWLKRKEAMPV